MDPDCSPFIPLTFIPRKVKDKLQFHLDVSRDAGWQLLAEQLQIDSWKIQHISYGLPCPNGFTSKLLEFIEPSVGVDELCAALEEIKNFAALTCLTDAKPEIRARYEKDQRSLLQEYFQSSLTESSRAGLSARNAAERSQFSVLEPPVDDFRNYILLTNARDGRAQSLNVLKWLRRNRFNTQIILTKEADRSIESHLKYTSRCFRQVGLIVVLITEGYLKEIDGKSDYPEKLSSKTTQYIFDLMRTEIFENGYTNRRFVPLLIDVPRNKVPLPLNDTKVFSWPKGWEQLAHFLSEREDLRWS